MSKTLMLLDAATVAGAGLVQNPTSDKRTYQARLSAAGGTATVTMQVSNDPLAAGETPDTAAWETLGTINLSGANDHGGFSSDAPWTYTRANMSSPTGSASVSAWLGV